MKTHWKILIGAGALLLVLVIGLNLYFTDERLKNMVVPAIEKATSRPVEIESLSLTFFKTFPRPGISLRNMSIAGDTEGDTLFSVRELTASLRLFSLFGDEIKVTELSANGPRFTYRLYEDGSTNIDFLLADTAAAAEDPGPGIAIPYIALQNGRFIYEDRGSPSRTSLTGLDARISLRYAGTVESTIEQSSGNLGIEIGDTRYISDLPVSLSLRSVIDTENERISLEEGRFSIRQLALELSGTLSDWSDALTLDLAFTSSSDNFGELMRLLPGEHDIETRGSLALEGSAKGAWSNDSLPAFNLNARVNDGYLKFPDRPQAIERVSLDLAIQNDVISVSSMEAAAGPNTLSASGRILQPFDTENRSVDFQVSLKADLATVKDFYPIPADTLSLRGNLVARATLKGKMERIEQAVQEGSFTLQNGYIEHISMRDPLRDIRLEAVLEGPRLTLVTAEFRSGDNSLSTSGIISNYLGSDRTVNLNVKGSAGLDQIARYYTLEPTVTSLTGGSSVDLNVKGPLNDPARMQFSGTMRVQDMNMDGPDSLGLVQPVTGLNGTLNLGPSAAELESLTFKFGSSDFALNGSLENYMEYLQPESEQDRVPTLTGSYRGRYLNMDELIDWQDTTRVKIPIHLPWLNTNHTASVQEMIITGVGMQNLKGRALTTPDRIVLEDARANLFEGTATGAFTWNVPDPERTNIRFKGSLDSLRIESFFREYEILGPNAKLHEYLSGTFSATTDYYTVLDAYLEPVIESTKMSGQFGMSKSRLQGHPVQEKIADFLKIREFRNMALDEWQSTYRVENAVMTIDSLRLTSGDIGAGLSGTRHLVDNTINYQVQIYLPGRYKSAIASIITPQATEALTQKNGTIMVPLRVTGTMNNPAVAPDQEVIQPIIQRYLKDKAGSVLKKLFGGN